MLMWDSAYGIAYSRAPVNMRGLVSAINLLNTGFAYVINLALSPIITDPHLVWDFGGPAIVGGFVTVLFVSLLCVMIAIASSTNTCHSTSCSATLTRRNMFCPPPRPQRTMSLLSSRLLRAPIRMELLPQALRSIRSEEKSTLHVRYQCDGRTRLLQLQCTTLSIMSSLSQQLINSSCSSNTAAVERNNVSVTIGLA